MTEHHQYILGKCQKYCSYQERSIFEVKMKLKEWKAQEKVAEKIIIQLIKDDYINEERFAKSFSIGKFRIKKWGKNKIIYELKKKQIPDLMIQIGLNEIDQDEYLQTLIEIISKKTTEIKETDPHKKRFKLAKFAINKGYRPGIVWDVINSDLS